MTRRYVVNWKDLLLVYFGVKKGAVAKFKDGETFPLSKYDHLIFYGELYKRHLESNGFVIERKDGRVFVTAPDGLVYRIPEASNLSYLLVFDEIYLMQVYGRPDLSGRTVIDVGASIADTALYFAANCNAKNIYAYEVDANRFDIGIENIKIIGLTQLEPVSRQGVKGRPVLHRGLSLPLLHTS